MTDTTLPGLIVPVEARIDKLERSLKRAADLQARAAGTMEKRAKQSADAMAKSYEGVGARIGKAFKGLAVPFLGGVAGGVLSSALGAVSTDIRGLIGDLGDLNDAADRLGVTTETLQGLQYGFKLQGVDIGETTSALEKFVDGIGQAAQGEGKLKATFDRAGISLRDQKGKLKDTTTLLKEFADLVDRTSDPAAKMALVTDAFGRGGKGMVLALEGGGQALDDMIAGAKEAGVVLDDGLVKSAALLDDKFDILTTKVQTFFQSVAVHAAEAVGAVQTLNDNLPNLQPDRGGDAGNLITPEVAGVLAVDPGAVEKTTSQLADISAAYDDLTFSVTQATGTMSGEIANLADIGDTDTALTLADITGQMNDLTGKMQQGQIPAKDYSEKMSGLATKAKAALEEAQKINKVDLSDALAAIDRIGGALDRVFEAAQSAVNEMGRLAGVTPGTLVEPPERTELPGMKGRGVGAWNGVSPMTSPRPKGKPTDIDFGVSETPRNSRSGGGAGNSFEKQIQDMQSETRALEAEAAALIATAGAGKEYGDAVEYAREKAKLLIEAQKEGKQITPELTAQIEEVAQAHVMAGVKVDEAADKLRRMQEAGKGAAESLARMFTGILSGTMTAGEALKGLLLQILEVQLQKQITGLFAGAGTGSFLGQLGMLIGFDAGGYTGDGDTLEPAGIVHRGEYVIPKRAVERIGLPALQELHRTGMKGYASGGVVGDAPSGALTALARASHPDTGLRDHRTGTARAVKAQRSEAGQSVTINAPVTVNANGGTQEQNHDLAQKVAREMEGTMRKVVQSEIIRQSRPGNMLDRNQ
ncbi:hypothetical protein NX862_14475 [Rhodobacter sp. KR11]|uniref:hypothetical protein n=1 Tax=Rhodobacter sp. KR11 TaxID=2974588 RepID=UPI0022228DCA|nr:hypothetical protein [Rhodobacter sp. KR11]MCW1919963.1 hypothetical protein [Rhodobacter sp. KR11]